MDVSCLYCNAGLVASSSLTIAITAKRRVVKFHEMSLQQGIDGHGGKDFEKRMVFKTSMESIATPHLRVVLMRFPVVVDKCYKDSQNQTARCYTHVTIVQ